VTTGYGACLVYGTATGQACMCSSAAGCQSGTCGYDVDTNGLPIDVSICVANDGKAYDGCVGEKTCDTGLCCIDWSYAGTPGGYMCQTGCRTSADCDSYSTCQPLTSGTCSGLLGTCVPIQ
jgi:hypothetical protein